MFRPLTPTVPPTILISLKRTPERTEQALQHFRRAGIKPMMLWATDGADDDVAATLPRDSRCSKRGFQMQPGEVGCAMSWWRAAAMIVRNDWPMALVFEDDFTPVLPMQHALQAVGELPANFDIALLHNQHTPAPTEASGGHTHRFRRVINPSYTTVALAISNKGARAILAGLAPFDRPVDVWITNNEKGLVIYQPNSGTGWFEQDQWRPSTIRKTHGAGQIPKYMHRIWVGPNPIPDEYERHWASWKKHHPDWMMTTWDEKDLASQFAGDVGLGFAKRIPEPKRWAAISDIARLLILQKFGGMYVDTDFECFRSFQRLVDSAGLLLADMTKGDPCNGLMAASPNHPMLEQMVRAATDGIAAGSGTILEQAGPAMVKRVLGPWITGWPKDLLDNTRTRVATAIGDTGITIIEPWVCFPYYWADERPKDFGRAWAAHHWARSWWGEKEWSEHNAYLESKRRVAASQKSDTVAA